MKSDKKHDQRIWRTWAVVLWSVAAGCFLILIVDSIDSTVGIWLVGVELLTIFSMAFGMLFFAIDQRNNSKYGKRPRVLLGFFMAIIFIIWPIWTWNLPDDGPVVYGYWKFSGTIMMGLFGFTVAAVVLQKYAAKRKSVDRFFKFARRLDDLSSLVKYVAIVISAIAVVAIWQVLADPDIIAQIVAWMLSFILGNTASVIFKKIKNFFQEKPGSETGQAADEPVTHAQLLALLKVAIETSDNTTVKVNKIIAAIEHMADDLGKPGP